ncbi:cytochrome c oxidase assembly protein [Streptomyces sp. NPDC058372]|uniref:cytochrome c oxidase assembly protein n=1 Tax=Streptomyces sp. NPDC058372 TaxID=3346464 RepID=UPI00364E26C6
MTERRAARSAAVTWAAVGPVPGGPFTAHMTRHLILGMTAPLLIVLARPLTPTLRILSPGVARRGLLAFAHSRPAGWLIFPPLAALLDVGGLWLLYRTELFSAMQRRPLLHAVVHAHVLATGLLFTFAVCRLDPVRRRWGLPLRGATLLAAGAAQAVLVKILYAAPPPGATFRAADLHTGSQVMGVPPIRSHFLHCPSFGSLRSGGSAREPPPAAAWSAKGGSQIVFPIGERLHGVHDPHAGCRRSCPLLEPGSGRWNAYCQRRRARQDQPGHGPSGVRAALARFAGRFRRRSERCPNRGERIAPHTSSGPPRAFLGGADAGRHLWSAGLRMTRCSPPRHSYNRPFAGYGSPTRKQRTRPPLLTTRLTPPGMHAVRVQAINTIQWRLLLWIVTRARKAPACTRSGKPFGG